MNNVKAVVFAGDYAYIRQIETALKSLYCHNHHLKIYLFNQDIPVEWFVAMRQHVETLGGELLDVKLLGPDFQMNWSNKLEHINHMTFARYFIPDFVDEDKILYLDSDLVVTGNLDKLFETDLGDNYVAAVDSCFGAGVGFNAGVLLINNRLWKADQIRQLLVETTEREHANVNEGDQSILNMVFGDRVVWLDESYNYQIGFDQGAATFGHQFIFDKSLAPLPTILHYISPDKPWNQFSVVRLRDQWWHYHLMEWSAICDKWQEAGISEEPKVVQPVFTCFNFTHSYSVEQIEYLVQQLPEVHFRVAAFTNMAVELTRLSAYPNVTLNPNSFLLLVDQWMKGVDLYLDINHEYKVPEIYDMLDKYQIPKLTFDNTQASGQDYQAIISHQEPEQMVAAIRRLVEEKR